MNVKSIGCGARVLIALGLVFGGGAFDMALAGNVDKEHVIDGVFITDAYTIRRGGRLYANWADELEGDLPTTTHPAYPAAGKKSGATTWRCKECHGWDYKGVNGVYGSGSHFTGIKGIESFTNKSPSDLIALMRDNNHQYTPDMIPDEAISDLAHFLALGRFNSDAYIDRKTKLAQGDVRHGAEIFQTVCAVCHGLDGKLINFRTEENPEYVGTVANANPWEGLHNIRFGKSGNAMIGLFALGIDNQLDVLAYTQTLPQK